MIVVPYGTDRLIVSIQFKRNARTSYPAIHCTSKRRMVQGPFFSSSHSPVFQHVVATVVAENRPTFLSLKKCFFTVKKHAHDESTGRRAEARPIAVCRSRSSRVRTNYRKYGCIFYIYVFFSLFKFRLIGKNDCGAWARGRRRGTVRAIRALGRRARNTGQGARNRVKTGG